MSDDTISRQGVLRLLDAVPSEEFATKAMLISGVKALPSAQPEPTTEIQEILNYLDTTLHPIVSPDNWNVYAELHDMVSKLPRYAQPERKKGRWIDIDAETYTWKIRCDQCGHERSMLSTGQTYPRFCENCGADMRGDDHGTD